MRIAICEDEKAVAEKLAKRVDEFMKTEDIEYSVDVFLFGGDFLKSTVGYDLLFLDCELHDMNGLELARKMRSRGMDTAIIFVTAYDAYVYDSFEVNAFRYILKSEDEEDAIIKALQSFLGTRQKDRYINVPIARKDNIVKLDDIIYIESDGKYSIVRLIDNCYYKSTKSISYYEEIINQMPNNFYRTHRRFIVNMKYIKSVEKNLIIFRNGENAEISRRNISDFNSRYTSYLKNFTK